MIFGGDIAVYILQLLYFFSQILIGCLVAFLILSWLTDNIRHQFSYNSEKMQFSIYLL